MKTAIVTMVIGEDFARGAEVLFHSLARCGLPDSAERIVIGPDQCSFAKAVPITYDYSDIPVERRSQFIHNANKFFALTLPYDRIICVDSDMLCVGDCSYLWSDRLGRRPFYACRDTAAIHWHEESILRLQLAETLLFNCGVYVYHPAQLPRLHDDMLRLIRNGFLRSYSGGEQGYLNHYMQLKHVEVGWLPAEYNYCMDEHMTRVPELAIKLLHFAGQYGKPWNCSFAKDDWRLPWITRWWKEYALMLAERSHVVHTPSPVCDEPMQLELPPMQPVADPPGNADLRPVDSGPPNIHSVEPEPSDTIQDDFPDGRGTDTVAALCGGDETLERVGNSG
jgi:hypothetical protein